MGIDTFIKKVGLDRITHFGIGGAICAFVTLMFIFSLPYGNTLDLSWKFVLLSPLSGYWVVFIIELCKEFLIDSKPDKWDFLATMLGCVFVHIGAIIGYVFHFGNGKDLITTWWGWLIFGTIMAVLASLWLIWVINSNTKNKK